MPSARRSTSRASASAAARTVVKSHCGWMRTMMCIPREPDVRGKPTSPCSRSTSPASSATRRTRSHGASGIGSMSTRSSSGWSRSARRTGCGFQSTLPSETAHSRCAASTGTSSSASRPEGNFSTAVWSHSGRFSGTRFW